LKNVAKETPYDPLHGRTLFTTRFVDQDDIRNKRILDIGCGFGWFVLFALNNEACEVAAIEKSQEDLCTAKEYLNDSRLSFEVGTAEHLPFNDESFDTVTAWEVIEHLPQGAEPQMFREVWRILKEGGVFYLSTPYDSVASKALDPVWWLSRHRHYSRKEFVRLAEESGFSVETIVLRGGWWELISMINLYVAKWIFRRRVFFQTFFHRKLDDEYAKVFGFSTIFLKCVKRGY